MERLSSARCEKWLLVGGFCVVLIGHFLMVTQNWKVPFMAGQEFRQAQTALVCYYIEQQNNFSVIYETPVLGKPWVSILMEVPFYEWSVVWLSRLTEWPHYISARIVSMSCFYLSLPALYLLLGRMKLPRTRRLLPLMLILVSPVYIFYSRAFLMESMELMWCAWFLFTFVVTMDERRWHWLLLTCFFGIMAILVKGSTLAVWLLPAASYGVWLLWRDLRKRDWGAFSRTMVWGGATILPALIALKWWVNLTDPLKEAHASAWIFTSKTLSQGNWGLTNLGARFSAEVWRTLAERWSEAIMHPGLLVICLLAALVLSGPVRRWVLALGGIFFGAQILFPFAYAYQDYYFYACAVFLLGALGLAGHGLLESRLPRWVCGLFIAVPLIAQVSTYWLGYRPHQLLVSNGGFEYTDLIREMTPEDSVLVIAGQDWASIVPFYSQRKALMIRNGLEYDPEYLDRAFTDLNDENVAAVILTGKTRSNQDLLLRAKKHFGLEEIPTCTRENIDIYFSRLYTEAVRVKIRSGTQFSKLGIPEPKAENPAGNLPLLVNPAMARTTFGNIVPGPYQVFFAFGVSQMEYQGRRIMGMHPDTDIWIHAPAQSTRILMEYGILAEAYEREENPTDGIELLVTAEMDSGEKRVIYHRMLDPANKPDDRGPQKVDIPYASIEGENLHFSVRPRGNAAFDWAYLTSIRVE